MIHEGYFALVEGFLSFFKQIVFQTSSVVMGGPKASPVIDFSDDFQFLINLFLFRTFPQPIPLSYGYWSDHCYIRATKDLKGLWVVCEKVPLLKVKFRFSRSEILFVFCILPWWLFEKYYFRVLNEVVSSAFFPSTSIFWSTHSADVDHFWTR